ncbi:MAG TPA: hypothetical protein VGD50_03625, partial [Candidatus Baltobacteraceae bacterium]
VWLRNHDPARRQIVMETTDLLSFYSDDIWHPLPYADSRTALRYIASIHPRYVVVSAAELQARPYMAQWLAHGIPTPAAKPALHLHSGAADELVVYRWDP